MKPDSFMPTKKAAYATAEPEQIEEGFKLYTRAREGDQEATRKAYDYFNKLHMSYPGDDLVAAYYADCLSMTGRDATDSSVQFANAIGAIMTLEKLVNKAPDNFDIRLIRAYHAYRLPEAFFRRTRTAIEDFEYIIQRYNQDSSLMTEEAYWQLVYDLGKVYQRSGAEDKARTVWQKLFTQCPDFKYRKQILSQDFDLDKAMDDIASISELQPLLQEGIRLFRLGGRWKPLSGQSGS